MSVTTAVPVRAQPRHRAPANRWSRAGAGLTGLVVGAAAALAGAVSHQVVVTGVGARWPIGVVVALALLAGAHVVLRGTSTSGTPAALAGLGWLAVTAAGTFPGPGGDLLVPDNGRGYAWVLGGAAVIVVSTLTVRTARR